MATKAKSLQSFLISTTLLFIFIFSYPRILLMYFTQENPWMNYLYMYGFGLVFFCIGIWLILKSKACQLGRGRDSLWFKALIAGFIFFASLHGLWIYFALTMPYKGS